MSGEFIKEFLCGIGFKTDQASFAKFTGGVALGTAVVMGLNKVVGMAESAIRGMVNSVPELAAEYRQMAKDAENAGVSIGELDKMRDMAPFLESSAEAVTSSLSNINRAAGDTALGIGRAKVIFEKLGIAVKGQDGKLKSSAVLMREIGEAVKGKERGEQKAILERLGIDPTMLKSLTTDISGITAEFGALDDKIDLQGAAKASKELGKNINWIKFVIGKTREAFLAQLIGPVGKGIKYVADLAKKYFPVVIEKMKPVVEWLVRIGKAVATVGGVWIQGFVKIIEIIGKSVSGLVKLNDATGGWVYKIGAAVAAWKLLNTAFAASPLGKIILLASVLALVYDDYKGWKEGAKSFIDWGKWGPEIKLVTEAVGYLAAKFQDLGVQIGIAASISWSFLKRDFAGVAAQLAYLNSDKFQLPSQKYLSGLAAGVVSNGAPQVSQAVNQNVQILIDGSGTSSQIADRVKGYQERLSKDLVRNMKAVAQ